MTSPAEDRALVEFLVEYLTDREAGVVRPLGAYLARFPAHQDAVARRYLDLVAEREPQPVDARRIGPYLLLEPLGRGGQGEVWLAEHEALARRVALKILHAGCALGDDARSRFRREAEIASRVDHPGLCVVFETGRHHGRDWIAMRHVRGKSLGARLREVEGGVDAATAVRWAEASARALHAVHEAGVVHRDVKPANILIDEHDLPVVLDFGLARDDRAEAVLTRTGSVFGTPDWMAPEQVRGARDVDRRADVWALGCILYECLTGERPFAAPTVEQVLARIAGRDPAPVRSHGREVPRDLQVIVSTALEKDRTRRYQTALALADDLRRFRAHEPILARPAGFALRVTRFVQRNPGRAAALVATLLAAATVGWFAREAGVARAGLLRTDDYRRAEELVIEERESLWPVAPSLVAPASAWIDEAERRLARRDSYVADLARLEGRDTTLAETLNELIRRLDRLAARLPVVLERHDRAATLVERSIHAYRGDWAATIDAIARSPHYRGLTLTPQVGLVPLGENAAGFFEFWALETGSRPPFTDGVGAWLEPTSGLVLVLLPGGPIPLGASPLEGELAGTNANEPARVAHLAPYFLSKFETTQGEWLLAMDGDLPSEYLAGETTHGAADIGWTNPVESVSARAAAGMLARWSLSLPTEAQWEAACRAGTWTPWSFGSDVTCSRSYANLYGEEMALPHLAPRPTEARDPHQRHAAAGSYAPNRFGLHDMHGNVFEWCRDRYVGRPEALRDGDGLALGASDEESRRVIKGGSFLRTAVYARAALRAPFGEDEAEIDLGFRAARRLDRGESTDLGEESGEFRSRDR